LTEASFDNWRYHLVHPIFVASSLSWVMPSDNGPYRKQDSLGCTLAWHLPEAAFLKMELPPYKSMMGV